MHIKLALTGMLELNVEDNKPVLCCVFVHKTSVGFSLIELNLIGLSISKPSLNLKSHY